MRRLILTSAVLLVLLSTPGQAASPYVSLQDSYLNGRIDQLVVVANLPTMRKPYNVTQVRQHLEQVKELWPALYAEIDKGLESYETDLGITYAEVGVAAADNPDNGKVMPNARGERLDSNYRVAINAQYRYDDWLVASVGGLALDSAAGQTQADTDSDIIPVGSYLSLGWDSFQVDIGYREHWLSPFSESAMLVSTNARPSFSVGFSNPVAFESLWNLHYEVYVSRLEYTDNIVYGNELESGRPALLGFQLSIEPIEGWTLAANRTMQFGGGSREVDLRSIWDAFWDPVSSDNSGAIDCDGPPDTCEFGNQIASISSRMNFGGEVPFAILMEYAGEDTAGHSNLRLGNLAMSAGLHIPFLPEWAGGADWSFLYEFNEWQNAWYTHHIYKNGYTNDGIGMGHWGANDRVFGDGVGGRAQVVKLGWQRGFGTRYEFTYRQIENEDYGRMAYSTGRELDVRYFGKAWGHDWGYRLYGGKNVYDEGFFRGELIWQW
ncbi:capsule assembly Wzi family protein [Ferrimonas balearica]|uniref:capsule assembly Wzi family protein n=1 Tax=Ferrimonas balearica TaxID=44012 RepID=UPI001C98E62B|nr:capsule assembly Wzi family protein [Ferrimonas balearica]MBY5921241.1 capsule assembly Wzi family protein [Ferrimonas balearica]MBY5996074.1 capsule assembly Wzi family protein [Ferrimonas balearica]